MGRLAFIILSLLILFFIVGCVLFVIFKHTALLIKYNRLYKYLYNYLNIITSARYGNLNNKIEDGIDALTIQLTRNTNALLESVIDRDLMISEYIEKDKERQNLKQDFISGLAHDLKVPIIAQDNTYDLFLEGKLGELSEIQKEAVKNLKISNNDLRNLVLDLLDAHKLESVDFVPELEKTDIKDLISETIEQNKSILDIHKKVIHFESKSKIILNIDKFLIKRALNNLISNAVFYSKNSQNIYITLNKKSNNIHISVIDEGEGIKEDDINSIFNKYYSSSNKYSNVGTGLGLYIVNKIAKAHNGCALAENNKDKGAKFSIILPCD